MLVRKNIQIEDTQDEQLRTLAFNTRLSESEHIRRALNKYFEEVSQMKNNQMTAREFLAYAGVEDSEANLYALTQYTDSPIDFAQFPDANIPDGLAQNTDEPAGFQEYLDRHGKSEEVSPVKNEMTRYYIDESIIVNNEILDRGFTLDTKTQTVEWTEPISNGATHTFDVSECVYNDGNNTPVSLEDGELIGTPELETDN